MNIMSLLTRISADGATLKSNANESSSNDILSKDAFLRLFVTQLQYQNPLEPMENTEFVQQLATFSTLEQLANINVMLEQQYNQQREFLVRTNASSILGKEVWAVTEEDGIVHGVVKEILINNETPQVALENGKIIPMDAITKIR